MKNEFLQEMQALLGSEFPQFLRALDDRPALALRVNPLRPFADAAAAEFIGDAVPWAETGFYIKYGTRPGTSPAHDLGAFYLQEASAMVSAAALQPRPGEKILDLCAAPGGKSTQIAGAMGGEGVLVSNEPVPSRAKILAENLERMGVVNAIAVSAYPDQLARHWPEFFDAVLVDAPCSGEGMFRREPASREEWQPGSPEGCARRQADILDEAAKMLRPGGRLVYSTCTFNHWENEGSIEAFLNRHPEFFPEDFSLAGIGDSVNGMIRVWPHRVRGDGHFACRLRKADGERREKGVRPEKRGGRPKPRTAARTVSDETPEQLIARLEKDICRIPEVLRSGTPIRQADYVHLLPAGAPPLDGIKVLKPGLCLMRVGRSHVQPMPPLARACQPEAGVPHLAQAMRVCPVSDDEAARIMKGERLRSVPVKGWTLLTWHNLPLTFIKSL